MRPNLSPPVNRWPGAHFNFYVAGDREPPYYPASYESTRQSEAMGVLAHGGLSWSR